MTIAFFLSKWELRFPNNDTFDISAADLREFKDDIAATFGTPVVNVPTYDPDYLDPAGFLVRYSQAGGRESFYYARVGGVLPHPTYNQSDANWKLVPGPVAETALSQYITLFEAQGMEGDNVVRGRRYGVHGLWNGSTTEELVEVDGLENTFRKRGTLVRADGTQQEVDVNVLAGTYTVAASGGGGGDTQYTELVSIPSLRVVYLHPPQAFTIKGVKLRENTKFVEFQVNTLVAGVWVPGAVQTYAGANVTLAGLSQAQYDAGVEVAMHAAATDDRFNTAAVLAVSAPWLGGGWQRWVTDRANFRSTNTGKSVEPTAGLPMNMVAPAINQGFYFEHPALAKCAVSFWMRRDQLPDFTEYWLASSRPANNALVAGYTNSATFYVENQTYSSGSQGMAPGQWCRVWILFWGLNAGQITLFGSNPGANPTQGPLKFQWADLYFMTDHPTSLQLADREFAPSDASASHWPISPNTDPTQPVADVSGNNRTGYFFGF